MHALNARRQRGWVIVLTFLAISFLARQSSRDGYDSGVGYAYADVSLAETQTVYQIDAAAVKTIPSIPTVKNTELGTCICDLTEGVCDTNCACDPDCTPAEVALFSEILNPGPVSTTKRKCVDPDVVRLNKRGSLTANIVNNLLCIELDNSPSKGFFYDSPTSLSDAEFVQLISSSPSSFATTTSPTSSEPATASGSAYKSGNPIGRALYDGAFTSLSSLVPNYLSLPRTGLAGICSDRNPLRFGIAQAESCIATGGTDANSSPATLCAAGTVLDANYWLQSRQVGVAKRYNVLTSSTSQFVQPLLGVVRDVGDGSSVPATTLYNHTDAMITEKIAADWVIDPLIVSDVVRAAVFTEPFANLTGYTIPTPTWNAGTCTCSNALKAWKYNVIYDPETASITQVYVDIDLGTVTATEGAGCASTLAVEQTWKSGFSRTSVADEQLILDAAALELTKNPFVSAAIDSSNVTVPATGKPRSGNPGYIGGLPVLAGNMVPLSTDGGVTIVRGISESAAGLTTVLYDTASLECVSQALNSYPATTGANQVRFQVDATFSCKLPLTLAELATLCDSASNGLEEYLTVRYSYVGRWGNSSMLTPVDWVLLENEPYPVGSHGTWVAASQTCSDLADTLNIQIAYANFGSVLNAQRAIIRAKTSYSRNAWTFTEANPLSKQVFQLKVNVAFYEAEPSNIVESVPSKPPLAPKLPADFLYPFYVGRSAAAPNWAYSAITIISLTLSAIIFTLIAS